MAPTGIFWSLVGPKAGGGVHSACAKEIFQRVEKQKGRIKMNCTIRNDENCFIVKIYRAGKRTGKPLALGTNLVEDQISVNPNVWSGQASGNSLDQSESRGWIP
jgi:hypothetical protein